MNRMITIIFILLAATRLTYADTPSPITLSGTESQAITPVITDNPDQTIHLQSNTSAPSQSTTSVTTPSTIDNGAVNTGPNSMDENGTTINTNTAISTDDDNSTNDTTTPTSIDDSGNTTNNSDANTDINTNLNTPPNNNTSPTSPTTNNTGDINHDAGLNTNPDNSINNSPNSTSTTSPAVNAPPTLNKDSGTANDSNNSTNTLTTPMLVPTQAVPLDNSGNDSILDNDEDEDDELINGAPAPNSSTMPADSSHN